MEYVHKIYSEPSYSKGYSTFKLQQTVLIFKRQSKLFKVRLNRTDKMTKGDYVWDKKAFELRKITPTYAEGLWMYKKLCKNLKGKVLDAGCGANPDKRNFLPKDINYLGIDNSKIVEEKSRNFNFQKEDLNRKLNLQSDYFDYVICWSVLEHIKNDDNALNEFNRVLKTDGKLILGVPLNPNVWDYQDVDGGHYRRYNYFDLKRKLINRGFLIRKRYFLRTGMLYIYRRLVRFINKKRKRRYYPNTDETPVKILKFIAPIFKFDKYLFSRWGYWGLNVIIIAEKCVSMKARRNDAVAKSEVIIN